MPGIWPSALGKQNAIWSVYAFRLNYWHHVHLTLILKCRKLNLKIFVGKHIFINIYAFQHTNIKRLTKHKWQKNICDPMLFEFFTFIGFVCSLTSLNAFILLLPYRFLAFFSALSPPLLLYHLLLLLYLYKYNKLIGPNEEVTVVTHTLNSASKQSIKFVNDNDKWIYILQIIGAGLFTMTIWIRAVNQKKWILMLKLLKDTYLIVLLKLLIIN